MLGYDMAWATFAVVEVERRRRFGFKMMQPGEARAIPPVDA